ncbi:MAG: hypothetical protein ACLFM1_07015 [Bacteroidales bacterium]
MEKRKLTKTEWGMIIVAVVLVVLIALSWDRVSSRIEQVWKVYTETGE